MNDTEVEPTNTAKILVAFVVITTFLIFYQREEYSKKKIALSIAYIFALISTTDIVSFVNYGSGETRNFKKCFVRHEKNILILQK